MAASSDAVTVIMLLTCEEGGGLRVLWQLLCQQVKPRSKGIKSNFAHPAYCAEGNTVKVLRLDPEP